MNKTLKIVIFLTGITIPPAGASILPVTAKEARAKCSNQQEKKFGNNKFFKN